MIGEPQCLVVNVFVQIALFLQEGDRDVFPPTWPVMTGEQNVCAGGEEINGLVDIIAPRLGVADLCTAWCDDVVQMTGAILGHA